jgi:hypothetical protein
VGDILGECLSKVTYDRLVKHIKASGAREIDVDPSVPKSIEKVAPLNRRPRALSRVQCRPCRDSGFLAKRRMI